MSKGGGNINDLVIILKKMLENSFSQINVHNEEGNEAVKKPYFFVKILNSNETKELNRKYKRTISFEISYVGDENNINEDYLNMADELYELLEFIEIEKKKYRAINMKHEVKDKTLYFMFELNLNLMKKIEENNMNELGVDVRAK